MNATDKIIPLREVCKLIQVRPDTIREWAKSGKISSVKTPTGQTLYPESQFRSLIGSASPIKEKEKIIYCRVSSSKQLNDLQRQVDLLRLQYPEHKLVTDCASGINWKRNGLKSILESSLSGNLKEVVVAHKDRLSRFGFELLDWIISRNGGKIIVLDEDINKSSEQELAEDLLSIVHIYSCRAMGKRRYNNKINKDKTAPNKGTEDNSKTMDGNM